MPPKRKRPAAAPNLSRRVRAGLLKKGMTMLELAHHLDMSRQGLYFAMSGSRDGVCRRRLLAWLQAVRSL